MEYKELIESITSKVVAEISEGNIGLFVDLLNKNKAEREAEAKRRAEEAKKAAEKAKMDQAWKALYPNGFPKANEEYKELVESIVYEVLEAINPVRVGADTYHLDSVADDKQKAHIAKLLKKQNAHIDSLSAEERANREAQLEKSIAGTAKTAEEKK